MENYLTISEAATLTRFAESYLKLLAQVGTIKAVTLRSGEILVNEHDLEGLPNSFEQYRGILISLGEASREFGIPHQTISRWVAKKYLEIKRRDGQKVFIDKAEMAEKAYLYKLNPGQGHWTIKKSNH